MIEQLIAKYEPINSIEKVDALINDIKQLFLSFTPEVKLEVMLHIKKAKLQMYFNESCKSCIVSVKKETEPTRKTVDIYRGLIPNKKKRKKERRKEREQQENVANLIPRGKLTKKRRKRICGASRGLFDPNNEKYQVLAKSVRSGQIIRNYDGQKFGSVHLIYTPMGGQNKKY